MTTATSYLAIDLGASGGRAVLGQFDGERLQLEEVHRFENRPVAIRGGLFWNVLDLFQQIKNALGRCTQRGVQLDGIGIDTWGVDFGLCSATGELLALPRHYRDARNVGMMEQAFERVPRAQLYEATGVQFLPFNSVFQLLAVATRAPRLLSIADRMLFMPDLFTFWLTGAMASEQTIASTSQMIDTRTGHWCRELLAELGLPTRLLPRVDPTGTIAGELLRAVVAEVGQAGVPVIRTAGHDTACAVAAVPARERSWAYISSGTWSCVGAELSEPLICAETLAANFTNETGVAGTTRFLTNVTGLWLVQECQRTWAAQGRPFSFEELARRAAEAPALRSQVDPNDPRFAEPGDMPSRIRQACEESGQPVPDTPGAVVRCALESLATKYRDVLTTMEGLLGRKLEVIHIVGGGAQNELLSQFTADATGKPVVAGPAEATAAGNVMIQALAQGRVGSLADVRGVVRASTELRQYEPRGAN